MLDCYYLRLLNSFIKKKNIFFLEKVALARIRASEKDAKGPPGLPAGGGGLSLGPKPLKLPGAAVIGPEGSPRCARLPDKALPRASLSAL